MERVFVWLLAAGYPEKGVDWLRRRRTLILIVLALLSWALFIGLGWMVVALVF
jgi:hypothetical protein